MQTSPPTTPVSNLIYYPTGAQLNICRRMLKCTLKLTLKVLPHVSV
jgi:hypothetical protein